MTLDDYLKLDRCPHCRVDRPNLRNVTSDLTTTSDTGRNVRIWRMYNCERCGGAVIAGSNNRNHSRGVDEIYPNVPTVNDTLPERVKSYLQQAMDSTNAPSGSVMLCASAVDALLKDKGYKEGSLYKRIDQAKDAGLITPGMATWAHQVRLDANDERHVDEAMAMPSIENAKQCIEFVNALTELVYILPAKVTRGIEQSQSA
jgi:hypothetical protein